MSSRFLLATLLAGVFSFLAQAQPIRQSNPSLTSGVAATLGEVTVTGVTASGTISATHLHSSGTMVSAGQITGNLTGNVTGNSDTATALAADGSDCGSGFVATGVTASGAAVCAKVDSSAVQSSTNPVQSGGVYTQEAAVGVSTAGLRTDAVAAGVSTAALRVEMTQVGVDTQTHASLTGTSAHSAASANTASMIVARDGSGNFSAGTITASVTGASSLNVLKAGDTMTGGLTIAGASATPFTIGVSTIYVNGATGAVGIGNTAPIQALDVTGNITNSGVMHSSGTGLNYFAGGIGVASFVAGYGINVRKSVASDYAVWLQNTNITNGYGVALVGGKDGNAALDVMGRTGAVMLGVDSETGGIRQGIHGFKSTFTYTTGGLALSGPLTVESFLDLASKTVAQLEAITPTATHQVYGCSDCSNAVHVVVSTGSAVCQFDAFTGGTAWH